MKRANVCAIIGFVLTLLNIAASIVLIIIKRPQVILLSASVIALISLVLSIVGVAKSGSLGSGRAMSIVGIVLNALILLAVALFLVVIVLFMQACAGLLEGILTPQ